MRNRNFKKIAISAIASAVLMGTSASGAALTIANNAELNVSDITAADTVAFQDVNGTLRWDNATNTPGVVTSVAASGGNIIVTVTDTTTDLIGAVGNSITTMSIENNSTFTLGAAAVVDTTTITDGSTLDTGANILTATTVTNTGTLTLGGATHVITTLENNGTLNMADVSGGAITGDGTTNITAALTLSGAIKQTAINVNANTLTGGDMNATTITVANNVALTIAGADDIGANIVLDANATNASTLISTNDAATVVGNITTSNDGTGVITATNSLSITGNVGTATKSLASATVATAKTLTLTGNAYIDTTTLAGTGALTLAGTLTGDVTSAAGTGTITVTSGQIVGAIDATAAALQLDGNYTTGGAIKIDTIGVAAAMTMTVAHDLNVTGAGITLANDATTTLSTSADVTITGNILTATTNNGIFDVNNNVAVTGNIGANGGNLIDVDVASGKKLTVTGLIDADLVTLTGTSDLNASGNINIATTAISDDGTMVDGVTYTLISSGGTLTITADGNITDTTLVTYTEAKVGNTLTAVANYNSAASIGLTGEAAKTYAVATTAISSDSEISAAMNSMTAAQIQDAVSTMAPDLSASGTVGAINLAGGAVSTIGSRMQVARANMEKSGIATGNMGADTTFWVQAYNTRENQSDMGGISGYESNGNGVVFGLDKGIGSDMILGLAFSYGDSSVDSKNALTQGYTGVKSYQLTAYGSKSFKDFYVDGAISYGINNNDTSRHIVVGAVNRTASGSYDSKIMTGKVGAGVPFKTGSATFTPNASLSYAKVTSDSYSETGAGGMNLAVNNDDFDKITTTLGVTVAMDIENDGGSVWTPEVRVGGAYEAGDNYATSNASFISGGSTFNTNGLEASHFSTTVGLGLNYASVDKLSEFKLDLESKNARGYDSQTAILTAKFKF